MAKKNPGVCALCGRAFDNLTFEHIPPKASFNDLPARPVNTMEFIKNDDRPMWETDGLPYTNQQQGMGMYSLCRGCNTFTGTSYGRAYSDVARAMHQALKQVEPECTGIELSNVYPQRFIKQVISMFCSLNQQKSKGMESLRRFVLDKDAVGIDRNEFMVRMYLTRSGTRRHIPLQAQCHWGSKGSEIIMVSEITGYPFGFILYFNPKEVSTFEGVDITDLADYEYNTTAKIAIPLCIKEVNSIFSLDYRTKEEIERQANNSDELLLEK